MDKQSKETIRWVNIELDALLLDYKDNIPYTVWCKLSEIRYPLDQVVRKIYMDSE